MKELHIIIKVPGNGDPLDIRSESPVLAQGGRMASVAWKFKHGDNWYGDYFLIPKKSSKRELMRSIKLAAESAFDHLYDR